MHRINIQYNFKLPPEQAPKLGKMVVIILLFCFMNAFFFIFAAIKFIRIENYNAYNILFFLLVFSLGVLFCAAAFMVVYKYIIISVIEAGYGRMTPFFKTISFILGENFVRDASFKEKINKVLDFGEICKNVYGQKIPKLFQKAVSFFLNRLPFVQFLKNLSPDISDKDAETVSEAVYSQMDEYIVKTLFPGNNIKWLFFIFPANIVAQTALIFLLK